MDFFVGLMYFCTTVLFIIAVLMTVSENDTFKAGFTHSTGQFISGWYRASFYLMRAGLGLMLTGVAVVLVFFGYHYILVL